MAITNHGGYNPERMPFYKFEEVIELFRTSDLEFCEQLWLEIRKEAKRYCLFHLDLMAHAVDQQRKYASK
jgi:hypothetical protein